MKEIKDFETPVCKFEKETNEYHIVVENPATGHNKVLDPFTEEEVRLIVEKAGVVE